MIGARGVLGPITLVTGTGAAYLAGMPLAIITGASRGLGLALARALAAARLGARIDARGTRDLERAARELGAITEVAAFAGDIADDWHRNALADAAGDDVDLLVNNASVLGPSPQPPLAALSARRAGAGLSGQRPRATRAHPAGAATHAGRRADHQRHLRRRGRAL